MAGPEAPINEVLPVGLEDSKFLLFAWEVEERIMLFIDWDPPLLRLPSLKCFWCGSVAPSGLDFLLFSLEWWLFIVVVAELDLWKSCLIKVLFSCSNAVIWLHFCPTSWVSCLFCSFNRWTCLSKSNVLLLRWLLEDDRFWDFAILGPYFRPWLAICGPNSRLIILPNFTIFGPSPRLVA